MYAASSSFTASSSDCLSSTSLSTSDQYACFFGACDKVRPLVLLIILDWDASFSIRRHHPLRLPSSPHWLDPRLLVRHPSRLPLTFHLHLSFHSSRYQYLHQSFANTCYQPGFLSSPGVTSTNLVCVKRTQE